MLLQDGASLAYVKEQMGHSSIQVTVDIYGHLVPGGNIKWIDRLGSTVEMEPEVEPKALIAKGGHSK
jgi:integrase